ncbi:MAG: nucleoside recognition domain-containing protein [Paludibacteraceae bacterium]|nr:nucleoside recognition domain-containing protein [Paludibacteraceae bacterium]
MNKQKMKPSTRKIVEAIVFLLIFGAVFGFLGHRMGTSQMLNTIMKTSHDLLLNTCFYLMGITVLTGALGHLLVEFGVVNMLEKILRPLMKPLFNLPGVAALGAVLTFLSDNPAIITLANDKNFSKYFKKYQIISLTNFGTAFGMGLVVIAFMMGLGFGTGAMVGLLGAVVGSIVSTRLMQHFIVKSYPQYKEEAAAEIAETATEENTKQENILMRALNAILDGGKEGVGLGMAIIPGVLVISTAVMMMTFGARGEGGAYAGVAYEGVPVLPWLAGKIDFVFKFLFGFEHPELVAFPITALGAVGAAIGLLPEFIAQGFVDDNAIAVCTAIGMCWSGFLSTHSAMLDSLGYRHLVSKAIGAHTIGGLCAGISAHLFFMLYNFIQTMI